MPHDTSVKTPAQTCFQQGKQHRQRGNLAAAIECFRETILLQADFVPAYNNLANALQADGQIDQAIALYQQALQLAPDMAVLHCNLSSLWQLQGEHERAIAGYRQAIAMTPDFFLAHHNLGKALFAAGDFSQALTAYQNALRLQPLSAEVHLDCGITLTKLERYQEALTSYEHAISLKPDYAEAYLSQGVTFFQSNHFNQALLNYGRALALKPDYALALYNQGLALSKLNRCQEASIANEKCIAIQADYVDAYWNESLNRMLMGDYKNAWPKHEWRWQTEFMRKHQRHFSQPLWLGKEPILGKTILLHAEQGLGDTLQFCRYVELVAALGAKVVLEVYPPIKPLLVNLPGISQLLSTGEDLPPFDCHCPLLSLPMAFNTDLDTIPAKIPYLFSLPEKVKKWQKVLGRKTRPRVGLAWSGNVTHLNDKDRSIVLREFASLLCEGAHFFSLQKELRDDDALVLKQQTSIRHFGEQLHDLSDTAAIIEQMDIVISVDTAVAHLAAAMGKPVWILLHYSPDWRWLLNRSDSPWYPTVYLIRQPVRGDWQSALNHARDTLIKRIIEPFELFACKDMLTNKENIA